MHILRKRFSPLVPALIGLALLHSPAVESAELLARLPTEDVYFSDIPVVLSVTRLAQPKSDAPAAITVIDRSMIQASGIREVPELMRLVPGFQVGHDSDTQFGSEQTPVTYLGYSDQFSRKMQVLVDGRSVYDPMIGGVRWSELGLLVDDIERIEVIRGPNAASYGSNAFLGVINIVTRDPASASGTTAGTDLSSAGKRLATLRHFGGSNNYHYRISTSYLEDGPHQGRRDALNSQTLAYRGNVNLKNNDSLGIHLGISQGGRQLGDASDTLDPEHDGSVKNNYQQIKWTHRVSGKSEFSVQLYHNYSEVENLYTATSAPYTIGINASAKTHRWDLEAQQTFSAKNGWRWVWGAGARLDEAYSADWFNSRTWQQNYLYRLFGNGEWRPSDRWTFNLGAMAEQSSVAGDTLSPRLAANYHLNESDTFRAAVSRGYRNPSLFEEYANSVVHLPSPVGDKIAIYSDGSVHAEKVTNYELGYLHESANDRFSMDSRLFLMQFRDVITYYNTGKFVIPTSFIPTEFGNGGEADIYGVEVQGKYRFNRSTSLSTNYAYAIHNGWYLTDTTTTPDTTETSNDRTPTHTFSMMLDHRINGQWSTSLFYHYVSNVHWFDGTDLPNGYHIVNARFARSFGPGANKASFEIIGQNIAGSYFDFNDHLLLDRTVYLGIRLPL